MIKFKSKIFSLFIALSICFVSAVYPFAFAGATEPDSIIGSLVDCTFTGWSEVPEEARQLAQSYVDLFKSTDLKDAISSIEDIPIGWLKTFGAVQYALSPVSTVVYILNESGVLEVENTHSGHGGRHRVGNEQDDVVVDSDTLKKAVNTANRHYSPKNCRQYISFRTSDYSPRILLYSSGVYPNCFFEQGWRDGCYYTPFYFDGTDYYYTPFVYHDYLKLNDDGVTEYHSDVEDMRDPSRGLDVRVFTNQYLKSGSYVSISPFTTQLSCYVVYQNFENFLNNRGWSLATGNTFGSGVNTYTYYLDGKMSNPVTVFPHSDFSKLSPSVFDEKYPDFVNCDVGFFISSEPIEFQYTLDTEKIPDTYYITVNGDTIYDYSITNPDTGQSSTINEYITNNYTYITNNNPGGDGSGSGTTGGNVTVGGNVGVNGNVNVGGEVKFGGEVNVGVDVSPIDINVNVSGNGGAGESAPNFEAPDTSIFDGYLNSALDESTGIRKFIGDFFGGLPGEITTLVCIGLVLAILCRLFGR